MREGKACISLRNVIHLPLHRLFPASVMFSNYITLDNDPIVSEPLTLQFKSQV